MYLKPHHRKALAAVKIKGLTSKRRDKKVFC